MVFQVKLAFQGPVDGLDDLPQRLEELPSGPGASPLRTGRSKARLRSVSFSSKSRPKQAARRENRGACASAPDVAARRGASVNIQHRVSRQYRAAVVSGVSSGRSVIFASLLVAEFRQIGRLSDLKLCEDEKRGHKCCDDAKLRGHRCEPGHSTPVAKTEFSGVMRSRASRAALAAGADHLDREEVASWIRSTG